MTYTVSGGTLNPTHSVCLSLYLWLYLICSECDSCRGQGTGCLFHNASQ